MIVCATITPDMGKSRQGDLVAAAADARAPGHSPRAQRTRSSPRLDPLVTGCVWAAGR